MRALILSMVGCAQCLLPVIIWCLIPAAEAATQVKGAEWARSMEISLHHHQSEVVYDTGPLAGIRIVVSARETSIWLRRGSRLAQSRGNPGSDLRYTQV